MAWLKFTKTSGEETHIKDSVIAAVSSQHGTTRIYIIGDSKPFEVKESVEEVLTAASRIEVL